VGSFREYSATFNHTGDTRTSADVVAGVGLNPSYDVHPLDTLAENDIPSIAPRTGVGGDEKL